MIDLESKKNKILYYEIIEGRSKCLDPFDKGPLYIKHFGDIDSSKFEEYYIINYEQAISKGVPSEKEQIDYLIKEELWEAEKDKQILVKESSLKELNDLKTKAYLFSKINQINRDISKLEDEIYNLKSQKKELIGLTAEIYAQNKMEYYYIYNSFYIDDNLTRKKFEEENFEIENIKQFNQYVDLHNNVVQKFSLKNIKNLSLSDFIQGLVNLSENKAYNFFGKPVTLLTYYQTTMFIYAKYYNTILSTPEAKKLKDEIKNDADKLSDWYSTTNNLNNKLKSNNVKDGMVFVTDATEEDLSHLNQNSNTPPSSLDKLAQEKGGKLDLQDLVKFFKK